MLLFHAEDKLNSQNTQYTRFPIFIRDLHRNGSCECTISLDSSRISLIIWRPCFMFRLGFELMIGLRHSTICFQVCFSISGTQHSVICTGTSSGSVNKTAATRQHVQEPSETAQCYMWLPPGATVGLTKDGVLATEPKGTVYDTFPKFF